jgi:hypothetical protein
MNDVKQENYGKTITSAEEIVKLANAKKSIIFAQGRVPAAIIQNWQLRVVINCINHGSFHVYIPNVKIKKSFSEILKTPLIKLK